MTRKTLLYGLLVILVVSSMFAPVAMAQENATDTGADPIFDESADGEAVDAPDNTSVTAPDADESDGGEEDSEEADEEDDDEGSTIGNWVSGATPELENPIPSPSEAVQEIISWGLEDMVAGVEGGIDRLHFILVGLPAPGEALDPSTWVPPENGSWPYVFSVFGLSSAISIILLIFATQFALAIGDLKRKRKAMRDIAKAFFIGPVLGFPILALTLHTANAFAMTLAPSGDEFLMDYGNVAELGFGVLLGASLIKIKLLIIVFGLVILIVIYFAVLFLAAAWPALWAMRVVPIPTLQSWGNLGIFGFGKLVVLRVFQAFILRFTFEMPWGSVGDGTFIISVIGMAVGLLIALIVLPWIVLKKVTIASAVGLGMTGVSMDNINNAPRQIRSGVSTARNKVSDLRSTSPPRNTGKVRSKPYSGGSKKSATHTTRNVGSFGRSSSSTPNRSKSSTFQSKRNTDRAAKSRPADD